MRVRKVGKELKVRGVRGLLEGVFVERLVKKAVKMEGEKDWRILYCCLPYSARSDRLTSHSGEKGEKVEEWKDIGEVGRIEVSDGVFLRCTSAYEREVVGKEQKGEEELEVREGEVVSELEGLEDEQEQSLGRVLDDSQGSPWDVVDESLSGPNLDSYVHSAVLDDMFNWMLDREVVGEGGRVGG
jgi:hypothetical protein